MAKTIDCVVCGTCTVDITIRPICLSIPISGDRQWEIEPLKASVGGIVSNAGTALARLGNRVAAVTRIGRDIWQDVLRRQFVKESIGIEGLIEQQSGQTGTAAVLVDLEGERSIGYNSGAAASLSAVDIQSHYELFARSRVALFGYYSMLPALEPDLPKVLADLQRLGCLTAMDAAGSGGCTDQLAKSLPHLNYYIPSYTEAYAQTGETDPQKILSTFRSYGARGLVGVKLGRFGAMLSPTRDEFMDVECISPPQPVVDTTGAGDAFFAGLLTGVLRGMDLMESAQLASATAAWCICGEGATSNLRGWHDTMQLASGDYVVPQYCNEVSGD